MDSCVRHSRFLVALLLGILAWGELATTRAAIDASDASAASVPRSAAVSNRGGPRPLSASLAQGDMLLSASKFSVPTATPTRTPTSTPPPKPTPIPETKANALGTYKITGYSDSPHLNGTDGMGITASGIKTYWGVVAVDPRLIPLHSKLLIEGMDGVVFKALDTGGGIKGRWIDIWFPTDAQALQWGVQYKGISLVAD